MLRSALRRLGSPDKYKRIRAIKYLGGYSSFLFGTRKAVDALIDALEDGDEDVQKSAVKALMEREYSKHRFYDLIQRLEKQGLDSRFVTPLIEAAKVLNDIPEDLLSLQSDTKASKAILELLGQSGETRAVPVLIEALRAKTPDVRSTAARALGKLKDARAVEPLMEVLAKTKYPNRDKFVHSAAANALGELMDARAIQPLMDCLKSGFPVLRGSAARALRKIGNVPSDLDTEIEAALAAAQAEIDGIVKAGEEDARRPAKWPTTSGFGLHDPFDRTFELATLSVDNTSNDFKATIGLRKKLENMHHLEGGEDFTVDPKRIGMTTIPPGEYEVYLWYRNAEIVYRGDNITVKRTGRTSGQTISIILRPGGNYKIRPL